MTEDMKKRRPRVGEHKIVERIYDPPPGTDRLLDALRFLYEDSLAREAAEHGRPAASAHDRD